MHICTYVCVYTHTHTHTHRAYLHLTLIRLVKVDGSCVVSDRLSVFLLLKTCVAFLLQRSYFSLLPLQRALAAARTGGNGFVVSCFCLQPGRDLIY